MRLFSALFFFVMLAKTAFGQTFFPTPAPLLEQEVAPELANECFIFFENPGGDTLRLKWRKVEINFPEDWAIDLCDYGTCYTGIPAQGLMNAVFDTVQPYLKLVVQPGTTPGSGWLWFRVFEENNPDNFADVFFSLHTPGITATNDGVRSGLRIFPNPVTDVLFLENPVGSPVPARLYDAAGGLKWQGVLPPGERAALPLNTWPAGPYLLQTPGKTRVILHTN